jgi:phospholipid/cholesterol/gamma-HCH transport system permease protein
VASHPTASTNGNPSGNKIRRPAADDPRILVMTGMSRLDTGPRLEARTVTGYVHGRVSRSPVEVAKEPRVDLARQESELRISLGGRFTLDAGVPGTDILARELERELPRRLVIEPRDLEAWDSALVAFVHAASGLAEARGVEVDTEELPSGVRQLLALARAVPPRPTSVAVVDDAVTARVGRVALRAIATLGDALTFLGETVLAFAALLRGRARFRRVDLLHAFEVTGVGALGIVALINFLIGTVLAFVGAIQLQQFGASIFVANLVGIGITRELGALMTGIVMAGRTGASFAAVLGTMTVNEEIDALATMGFRPVEFLVLPRVLATAFMLPALVAYADLLGMLGGLFVGVTMLDLGAVEYLRQTQSSLPLRHVMIGLGKSVFFGAVVALTGCYYGIRCGRSAAAVGEATTRAVVMGIVLVVVVDAIATVFLHLVRL